MITLDNTSYSHVRGFNYQPSFGAHELEQYGYCYDRDTLHAELERGKALFPGMNTVRLWWSFCDVIGFHPYYNALGSSPKAFADSVDQHVRQANERGKALVASETGWGALDDARRAETLQVELGILCERKIGFTIHALQHSPVADLHRPDCGPVHAPGYMACIEANGSLRPYHEVINDYF